MIFQNGLVLKDCESQRSYTQAELFNICLKQTCFRDCWRFHQWFLCLKVLCKVYGNRFSNRLFDHPKICDIFLISSMVLDLLDHFHIFFQLYLIEMGTDRNFNRFGVTQDVALGVSKAFNRAWYTGHLHRLRSDTWYLIDAFKRFCLKRLHQVV